MTEWYAMSEAERDEEIAAAASGALEQLASCGARVVAPSEVPDSAKREALS